jgi:hypothetical protein
MKNRATLTITQKMNLFSWLKDRPNIVNEFFYADIASKASEELEMIVTTSHIGNAVKEIFPEKIRRRVAQQEPEACQIECKFEDTMINQQMIEGFMSTILTRLDRIEVALSNKFSY